MTPSLQFRRLGRAWHPCLDDSASLAAVLELDEALWVVTAAPVSTLHGDRAFLAFMDADTDGRLRPDEVRAAIRWLLTHVGDITAIRLGNTQTQLDTLPVTSLGLRAAATLVLARQPAPTPGTVTLEAVRAARLVGPYAEHPTAREADLADLEKLLLFQAWILPFVNSFVSCRDLYHPVTPPLFSWGTLVLDGRRFTLAVKVPDPARHEVYARRGALFVMYVEVGDRDGTWDYEVAVPVTSGMRGLLLEGLWGVFQERNGRERHARVRKLVVHAISIQDAMVSPFRTIAEAILSAEDKLGVVRDAARTNQAYTLARSGFPSPAPLTGAGSPAPPPPPAAVPPTSAGMLALAAGAGIAIAAVSSALTYVSDRFVAATAAVGAWIIRLSTVAGLPAAAEARLELRAYPLAVLIVIGAVLLAISLAYVLPVALVAWLRLRRRDLGILLIGSGWSVNPRMALTRPLMQQLTVTVRVPRSARAAPPLPPSDADITAWRPPR